MTQNGIISDNYKLTYIFQPRLKLDVKVWLGIRGLHRLRIKPSLKCGFITLGF